MQTFSSLPTGLLIATDRMDTLLMTLGGLAIDLTHLMHFGIKRLWVLSPLVMKPVDRAMGFESGFFLKSAPLYGARYA